MQGNVGTGNGSGTRAAVGLDDVAVNQDLAFAEFFHIDDGAQGAADQALDFLCAAGLFACGGFTAHTGGSGSRQHAVFGRYPALFFTAQKRGNVFVDGGRANHFGVAALDKAGTIGMWQEIGGDFNVAQAVGGAAGAGVVAHDGPLGRIKNRLP